MIPIPQYPIYSATIELLGGHQVGYYLDENEGWDLNMQELERSLGEAKAKGVKVTSLVLINPGNPTGQVLSKESVKVRASENTTRPYKC
jgi:alanine transaminase